MKLFENKQDINWLKNIYENTTLLLSWINDERDYEYNYDEFRIISEINKELVMAIVQTPHNVLNAKSKKINHEKILNQCGRLLRTPNHGQTIWSVKERLTPFHIAIKDILDAYHKVELEDNVDFSSNTIPKNKNLNTRNSNSVWLIINK